MNNGRAGIAFSITVVAILWFSIFALYGMEYLFDGNHWLAIGLWLLGVLALSGCIYCMCKSKANRSKRKGLLMEIPSIVAAITILLMGCLPFTMFQSVINHKTEFVQSIAETAKNVEAIDSSYLAYVNNRIAQYDKYLSSHHYQSNAKRMRTNSLRRRLLPVNMDSLRQERQEWLSSLDTVSIWNISTAKNFHHIKTAGDDWMNQYRQHASFFYVGEDSTLFEVDESALASQVTYAQLRTPHYPDTVSLFSVALCITGILTTYFYIRRPRNRYSGHHR